MRELYPDIEPYDQGLLDVGDGNRIHWEVSGNPDGKPAVLLHGGPGQGCAPGMRRGVDPARYRLVLFDQRGCGRSTPHAGDPETDLSCNTTAHLVADMELLREHLGIERWMVTGGSWGATLALAYAELHRDRVTEIVLAAITSGRRVETDWLYGGLARFFPAEWARFRGAVPAGENLYEGYLRLLADPDRQVRSAAGLAWMAWEDAALSLEPGSVPRPEPAEATDAMIGFARLCAHYALNGAFLEEGVLIRRAATLAGIPGVLVHGLLDLSCPFDTAWEVAQAWPGVELVALRDSGHKGSPGRREVMLEAQERFAGGPLSEVGTTTGPADPA